MCGVFFLEKPVLVCTEIDNVIVCGVFFQEEPVLVCIEIDNVVCGVFFQEKPVLVCTEIDNVIVCGLFFQEKPVLVRTPQAESKTIKRKLLHCDPTDDDGKWLVHLADLLATLTFSKHTYTTHAHTSGISEHS